MHVNIVLPLLMLMISSTVRVKPELRVTAKLDDNRPRLSPPANILLTKTRSSSTSEGDNLLTQNQGVRKFFRWDKVLYTLDIP